jgi:glycosyltransferase involved in cell wall biosynthesis
MHIFLNGLGASAGAGLTYLYNVVPHLSSHAAVRTTLAVQPHLMSEFANYPNITCITMPNVFRTARRFWFEQHSLPILIKNSGADVLISAGNFALRNSRVPQILLSGNSLYTSSDFYRDLRHRGEYSMWLDTRLKGAFARRSVEWADCTVAPSQSFADELRRWTGKRVAAIHHGFDRRLFFADQSLLAGNLERKLRSGRDSLRLLFVSHYNYYRNFETLLRATALIREQLPGRKIRLFLTCELQEGISPGTYHARLALELIRQLGIRDEVVELGSVPYRSLHHVYTTSDIYVTPAYTETFAHPLVEAMACGLPIIASNIPVHREICGAAALYFERFSSAELARQVCDLAKQEQLRSQLLGAGRRRAADFDWGKHCEALIEVSARLIH